MTRHYCDRCRREHTRPGLSRLRVTVEALTEAVDSQRAVHEAQWDVCDGCLRDIRETLQREITHWQITDDDQPKETSR